MAVLKRLKFAVRSEAFNAQQKSLLEEAIDADVDDGSLRAGRRAAASMSLIGSAKMNGLDAYVYLRDVLERLLTHPASGIEELLPHRWQPTPLHWSTNHRFR